MNASAIHVIGTLSVQTTSVDILVLVMKVIDREEAFVKVS